MRFTNLYHKLYGKLVLKNNRGNFSFSVQLTNKASTEPVTSSVCTYINDKPVVYASFMFQNNKASSIDLSNFNTSNVTNMSYMFKSIKASELDVSSFNTSKVTNTKLMFASMYNLLTIYSSDKFVIDNITDSYNMFNASTKLVGGAGTKYNGSYVDKTYARVDGGTNSPGYFTLKTN